MNKIIFKWNYEYKKKVQEFYHKYEILLKNAIKINLMEIIYFNFENFAIHTSQNCLLK